MGREPMNAKEAKKIAFEIALGSLESAIVAGNDDKMYDDKDWGKICKHLEFIYGGLDRRLRRMSDG